MSRFSFCNENIVIGAAPLGSARQLPAVLGFGSRRLRRRESVHLPFAPACASCTWTEISPVSRIPIQVKLQHPGTVTAFRLCYSILRSLVPCLASSPACSAGWPTPSCSSSCSTPSSQSRSLGKLVHCALFHLVQ